MNFLTGLSVWSQGFVWGIVAGWVGWYFAKPMLQRVVNDVVGFVNKLGLNLKTPTL